jgi:Carboxypeptidase regulatory-like domain/Beta-propeller repeat
VTGQTDSPDFPLAAPTQNTVNEFRDAFVTRLNASGSALVFSTYLGGSSFNDQGNGIAVDSDASIYVIGTTFSSNFPTTPNALKQFRSGSSDAFVTKIGPPLASIRISGRVLLDGKGLAGVTLKLTNRAGSLLQTTVSRSDGFYSFSNLPGGGDYTVTPSKTGYTFSPPFRTYNNLGTNATGQNFNAMLSTFSIFVTVEGIFGDGVPGVKITLSGSRNAVCTTGSNGFCQFADLPAGGNYTVTPMKAGGTFDPPSKTFNNLSEDQGVIFRAAFTISGQVTGINGIGIGGVTIKLIGSNNFHLTDITDSNGHYAFANVPAGGFYVVTPMRGGMTFNPESKTINSLTAAQVLDFQALVSITGKVRLEGTTMGISGVTMKLTGSRSATTTTNSEGIYTFANLPAGGNYTVTPMKTGFTFDPPSRTFTNLRVSQSLRTASFDGMH